MSSLGEEGGEKLSDLRCQRVHMDEVIVELKRGTLT